MSDSATSRAEFSADLLAQRLRDLTDPFDKALPPFADDFFNAVGRAVLLWGRLEHSFDNLLVVAREIAAQEVEKSEMQTSLSRKIDLLERLYDGSSKLAHLRSDAHYIAERITNLGDDRHLVMHSTWLRFAEAPPRIILRNAKHNRGKVRIRTLEPQISHLAQIAGAFHATRSQVLALILTTRAVRDPELLRTAQARVQAGDVSFLPIEI